MNCHGISITGVIGIYYQVLGTVPNRRVVIEYSRFSRLESETQPGDTGDFEIILYECSYNSIASAPA